MKTRVNFHCTFCNSDDVRRDADAIWNVKFQIWELACVYDQATCEQCGHETKLKSVPEAPQKMPVGRA